MTEVNEDAREFFILFRRIKRESEGLIDESRVRRDDPAAIHVAYQILS